MARVTPEDLPPVQVCAPLQVPGVNRRDTPLHPLGPTEINPSTIAIRPPGRTSVPSSFSRCVQVGDSQRAAALTTQPARGRTTPPSSSPTRVMALAQAGHVLRPDVAPAALTTRCYPQWRPGRRADSRLLSGPGPVVETGGIEPPTSCMPCKRSPS